MNIFIDANIYLSFYEQTKDALVELAKIRATVTGRKAKLLLPDQVEREFWKNRDASISSAMKEFDKSLTLGAVPRLVREDPAFETLTKLVKEAEKKRMEISSKVRQQVAAEATVADEEIRKLFSIAEKIDTKGEIFAEAHERALRHTPPGKSDGIGDRLSWVALLKHLPENSDLEVISADGDFAGEGDSNTIKPYLSAEWQNKKKGQVTLWKRASQFLAEKCPGAANAIEIERLFMIEGLEKSPNFVTTHSLIAEFKEITHLSPALANRLATALLTNSQISWIICDADVKQFATNLLTSYGTTIDPDLKSRLEKAINE